MHLSPNKVYGDRPKNIELKELEKRWDYADPAYDADSIDWCFSFDRCKDS